MKKILSLLLAIVLLSACFAGCQVQEKNDSTPTTGTTDHATPATNAPTNSSTQVTTEPATEPATNPVTNPATDGSADAPASSDPPITSDVPTSSDAPASSEEPEFPDPVPKKELVLITDFVALPEEVAFGTNEQYKTTIYTKENPEIKYITVSVDYTVAVCRIPKKSQKRKKTDSLDFSNYPTG